MHSDEWIGMHTSFRLRGHVFGSLPSTQTYTDHALVSLGHAAKDAYHISQIFGMNKHELIMEPFFVKYVVQH
jgi:hypothetical protein